MADIDNRDRRRNFTRKERDYILEKTGGRCARCGKHLDDGGMTVEHIWPLSKGGLNDEFNLVALCEDCNLEKSDSILPFSWYRFILPEYKHVFESYNNYASVMNAPDSIMQEEYTEYRNVSPQVMDMIKRNPKKAKALLSASSGRARLTKAYPGEAKRIFEFIKKCDSKGYLRTMDHYYNTEYAVYDDICEGEVYVLETKAEICAMFAFRKIDEKLLEYPQLRNIAENLNLDPHMVMVAAIGNKVGAPYFNDIMEDFFAWQVQRRRLPLFFNLLKFALNPDIYSNRVISFPCNYNGHEGEIEAHVIAYYREWYRDWADGVFKAMAEDGWEEWEPKPTDVDDYAEILMLRRTRDELTEDEARFIEERPGLEKYLMPSHMTSYGEGFSWRDKEDECDE